LPSAGPGALGKEFLKRKISKTVKKSFAEGLTVMPSAKIDGRGWKLCQVVLPRAGPSAKNYCCRVPVTLGKDSLPRAVLCRVPDHLPSANPQALGKDALSGSEPWLNIPSQRRKEN